MALTAMEMLMTLNQGRPTNTWQLKKLIRFTTVFFLLLLAAPLFGQTWSFSLVGDSRSGTRDFGAALNYIRNAKDPSGRQFVPPEFIIVGGDFDPANQNYSLYRRIFSQAPYPRFLPVMGNHDEGHRKFICDSILTNEGICDRFDKSTVSYYVDNRNVRIVAVDQYRGTGFNSGCINDTGIQWIEQAIASGTNVDHIFIAMHEPAFCRGRHVGDGFDACPDQRNRFWNMIVRHRDKVRAVFAAHTHHHSVMRVRDPGGPASDGKSFPFEPDGIYQFDAGGAGNSDDGKITVITFFINGRTATAEVVQSKNGQAQFSLTRNIDISGR
jgi:hypothetical protein